MAFWLEPEESATCLPAGTETVLVAVVPTREDWARVLAEHWYRIPVARAPRHLAARYLAFYHPAALGATRWTIPAYAEIVRYALVPRRVLLPGEPAHPRAGELYYRLDLGNLCSLPRPIRSARLRRVTFITTTLERLLAAEEVADLWLRSSAAESRRRAMVLGEARPSVAYAA